MTLYSLQGKAKVVSCVLNVVQSHCNSDMSNVFLFPEEIMWIQDWQSFQDVLCSPLLKLLDIQNSGSPPVFNKMCDTGARAKRIEGNTPSMLQFNNILTFGRHCIYRLMSAFLYVFPYL